MSREGAELRAVGSILLCLRMLDVILPAWVVPAWDWHKNQIRQCRRPTEGDMRT